MLCPGLVVFNTGDSLVAVDIRVHRDCAPNDLSASSPQVTVDVDDDSETVVVSEATCITSSSSLNTPRDATNITPPELRVVRERSLSSGKENHLKVLVSAESSVISGEQLCECDSEMTHSHCVDESYNDTEAGIKSRCNVNKPPAADSDSSALGHCLQSSDETDKRSSTLVPTLVPSRLSDRAGGVSVGMYPSFMWNTLPSHVVSSSCVGSMILQNDGQCCSYSVRCYSPDAAPDTVEGNN